MGEFFKILGKLRLSSTKTREISLYFVQFYPSSVGHWNDSHKHFHMFFCNRVTRHVHKQIRKRRYGEEKPGCFAFGKPVLFTLDLGLTMSYWLCILVWNFYQTYVIVSIEFWQRFEPQICSTRFAINVLFITASSERKARLCVKLFDFFPRWIRVLSQIQSRFLHGISGKKIFRENFS